VSRWAVLGARAPDRLILWGGGPAEDLPADRLSERFGTRPVEIVHGLHDRVVPLAGVERAASRLRAHGVAIELRSYQGGHRIDPALLASVAAA
jgi:predicted esterase